VSAIDIAVQRHMDWVRNNKPELLKAPPRAPVKDDQPAWAKRIEAKLDTLIAALADEEDPPVRSLDNGRTFAARDDKRGLG
jgi:hypothetical protein